MGKKQITEEELKSEITNIRRILREAKKVSIIIPTDPDMPEEEYYKGFINGCPFAYKRNELVEVPEPIAQLIDDNIKTIRAAKRMEDDYSRGAGKLVSGGSSRDEALANAQAILGISGD